MEKVKEYYRRENVAKGYEKKRILPVGGRLIDSKEKEIVLNLTEEEEIGKVLDVGAGTGRISILLAKKGYDVTAFDQSGEMLKIIKEKSKEEKLKIRLVMGDALKLPFKDNTFDACVSLRVLWHSNDPQKLIKEIIRVTKKDGIFVFDLLNKKSLRYLYTPIANKQVYTKLLTKKEIMNMLKSENLSIVEERQDFILPYIVYRYSPKFLVNFLNRIENSLKNTRIKKYSSVFYYKVRK